MHTHLSTGSFSILLALTAIGTAEAETIYVTTAADVVDFAGAQRVADLPGADGKVSLAEAGLASDNTPGIQTIGFHVPQIEWEYQWLYPGRAVLNPFLGFRLFEPAILDGTTQTAFTGETNPDGGAEVVIWSSAFVIDSVGSEVRGLDHTVITVSGGSANVVQGNTASGIDVYDSPFTLVGGTSPGQGNSGGTIKIDRTSDCVVVGNTVQRVRVLGGGPLEPPALNNRVGGPTLAERNFITGYGTFNGEGCPGGTTVQIFEATGTIVENNWIGTTPDGMAQGNPASVVGVGLEGVTHDTIIRDNRIAGIRAYGQWPHCDGLVYGNGIQIYGTGSTVTITGNTIGLDALGEPSLGSVNGVLFVNYYQGPVQSVVVGGTEPGEGNEIAGHLLAGVAVGNTFGDVRIWGNSIHDNGGSGIDLITVGFLGGPTPNDPFDGDLGANGLQNYPVLSSATGGATGIDLAGTLNSLPNELFRLEFFATPVCDALGFGEGQTYLGATEVATDAAGNVSFAIQLPTAGPVAGQITATATRLATGSTSEFSACLPFDAICVADFDGSGAVDGADLGLLIGAWGSASSVIDLNDDGTVDASDLGLLLGAWGSCNG